MSELNADLALPVRLDTNAMEWQSSPGHGVLRKRLELRGAAESGRVTSLVQYLPGSRFPAHRHPEGEEILVVAGTFEDEHGVYPTGTYVLNPDGSGHAPAAPQGCTLLVKLRQYPGVERPRIVIDTRTAEWTRIGPGIEVLTLYAADEHPESVRLVRLSPGCEAPAHERPGGEEIFVLEGTIADELGEHRAGTWLRLPDGSRHVTRTNTGCLLYVKRGHLCPADLPR